MNIIPFVHRSLKNMLHVLRGRSSFFVTDILLTYYCTQKCMQCSFPERAPQMGRMTLGNFKNIIDKLDHIGTQIIVFSGGEPLLNPQLFECIEYAAHKKFTYKHILSTLYASRKKVEAFVNVLLKYRVSITSSFDGFGETADMLRGVSDVSRTVLEHMEYLARENRKRGTPIKTIANIVISPLNMEQIPTILERLERIGWLASLDVYRKNPDYPRDDALLILKDAKELQRVIAVAKASPIVITPSWLLDGFVHYTHSDPPKLCPYLSSPYLGSRFFVHPDGTVKICLNSVVGNLVQQTPEEILTSKTWKLTRSKLVKCNGCWNSCFTPIARISNYNMKNIVRLYGQNQLLKEYPETWNSLSTQVCSSKIRNATTQ